MKRYGSLYKFKNREEFIAYFGNCGGMYRHDDDDEFLSSWDYDMILKDDDFPLILKRKLNENIDERTMGIEYKFTWDRDSVGAIRGEIAGLEMRLKTLKEFLDED